MGSRLSSFKKSLPAEYPLAAETDVDGFVEAELIN
jgi:hypothetical protein